MSSSASDAPTPAEVEATVHEDGTAEVVISGAAHRIVAHDVDAARTAATTFIAERAARHAGRPVRVATTDPTGHWQLLVHPDGTVEPADVHAGRRGRHSAEAQRSVIDLSSLERPETAQPAPEAAQPTPETGRRSSSPQGLPVPPVPPASRPTAPTAPTLADLIATRPAPATGPAQQGWQSIVRRVTGGLVSPGPGHEELAYRGAVESVQRSLDGPKTVVVVNPKGGGTKTTATMLLASTFGIHRGGYTLAWDNNETRGTLGWRARPARHTNTAVDLLRDLPRFTDVRAARVGDLDNYVRSQGSAQFDVLASDEDPDSAASIDAEAFHRLHRTLSRFYRVLVVDTGNNMRASNWQAAVEAADQLVIVSTVREDTAQSAAWLVDALRAAGQEQAVQQAVTVLTAPSRTVDEQLAGRLHDHFGQLTRTVIDIPYDPSLTAGGPVLHDALSPASRQAWLRATAAVADGL